MPVNGALKKKVTRGGKFVVSYQPTFRGEKVNISAGGIKIKKNCEPKVAESQLLQSKWRKRKKHKVLE